MFTAASGYGRAKLAGHIGDTSTWGKQRALRKTRVSVTRRREEEEGNLHFTVKTSSGSESRNILGWAERLLEET